MKKPLILVTNDDGVGAKGFSAIIEIAKKFGDVLAVGPSTGQSGMSHALTFKSPVRLKKIKEEPGLRVYELTGTPVDCVKMALDKLMNDERPALLLSGINHGCNSSISAIYSGTVAAAREGGLNSIPSIALSSLDYSHNADFEFIKPIASEIIENVMKTGLPEGICLNVNFPYLDPTNIKGVRVCRQAKGVWVEEFEHRLDPAKQEYYWLTGYFNNFEPEANDTDEWLLKENYVTLVPIKIEATAFEHLDNLAYFNSEVKI